MSIRRKACRTAWSPSSRRAWIEIEHQRPEHQGHRVALLAEGVDRNQQNPETKVFVAQVALLAEGVDRNFLGFSVSSYINQSPSSRRAGIEISKLLVNILPLYVALLAEGGDRNECFERLVCTGVLVALLAEGGDRNSIDQAAIIRMTSRPPRGGRG